MNRNKSVYTSLFEPRSQKSAPHIEFTLKQWNDLTIKWIDLVWNDLTMEQGDRKPIMPVFYTCTRSTHVYCFVKTDVFL